MSANHETLAHAPVVIQEHDQSEIQQIYAKLLSCRAKLVGPGGQTQNLPNSVYAFLCQLLADLAAGQSVSIIQSGAELTTVEAGKLLGVSRQFLVNLLEKGEIPFHMVGTHRRVYIRDLLAYKGRRDTARRKSLDDLVRAEVADGTYFLDPNDPQ